MDTSPAQTQAGSVNGSANNLINSSQPRPTSQPVAQSEEREDVGELEEGNIRQESQPFEAKIDVNVLKNEILVDGMQV